nr:PBECR4 domain-containing protein [uncultured Acetatifactor sp.]
MRNVHDCVEAFGKLLDKEYHLVLGRKNIAVPLRINFEKKECFHLMGLQYLTDRPELVHDRGKIFDAIRERRITAEQLQSSDLYYKIADRIHMLPLLESIIDRNDTIFKYNQKRNIYSVIKADYIMKSNAEERNLFLFLAENGGSGRYYCRSFFPQDKMDYTKNQASWTLLYKKKVTLSTGEGEILYDRLKKGP